MGNEQIEQLAQHNDNNRMTALQMLTGQVIHSSSFTFFPFYYNIAYQLNRESSIHHMNQLEQFKYAHWLTNYGSWDAYEKKKNSIYFFTSGYITKTN